MNNNKEIQIKYKVYAYENHFSCYCSIFSLTKKIKRSAFNVLKNETKKLLKKTNWINQVADPFDIKIIKKN
jgi:hypothetical protein